MEFAAENRIPELLKGKKHLHFIGIGGSGMFPIVQILHGMGYFITGSDNNETDTLKMVRKLGIPVTLGQAAENIAGADLIVHTAAIMADNPELVAARASGVPVLERSEMLGALTRCYRNTIAVSGTHGKTTTTSMLTQILLDAGKDPTAVIGGKLKSIGGNGRLGHSEIMVCEACEFVDTFLHLSPAVSIILNIDQDHMDYFKTMENLCRSFSRFCDLTSRLILANGDDPHTMEVVSLKMPEKQVLTFGLRETNDYYAARIEQHDGLHTSFNFCSHGQALVRADLHIPGRHNIVNAVAAMAAAVCCGVTPAQAAQSIAGFTGAGRRFEFLGKKNGVTFVDDYAHHPAEIRVTLEAAKSLRFRKVWAVHQPFTYSRTAMLLDDFAQVLSIADHVVLSEIMGSREKNTYGIYAKDLAEKIPGAVWFSTFEEISDYVLSHAEAGDLVITMGCGDVYKAAKMMLGQQGTE
ncbi:MAG TPA: UDP-N-acetylmuramate--L-alanine ligase [Firmicutes bacterium]|nr:UDP-N-acetylmuramate--L-alanine ligase [Bacillota bacterium]